MAWKKVFDNEHLLSAREYKIAEKFVEKDDRKNALFFNRNKVHSTEKYDIFSGVVCHIDWDEFCDFTQPKKCFFIYNKESKRVIAITEQLDKNKDSIIKLLKYPYKLKDMICTDVTNQNAIFNVNKETIIPVKAYLQYDNQGNIYTEETIRVTKKTFYKDGVSQAPIYSGHEEIIR